MPYPLPPPFLRFPGPLEPAETLTETQRETKRRRIEHLAECYLKDIPLFIQSAALRGPFDHGWTNPWGKDVRSTQDKSQASSNQESHGMVVIEDSQATDNRGKELKNDRTISPAHIAAHSLKQGGTSGALKAHSSEWLRRDPKSLASSSSGITCSGTPECDNTTPSRSPRRRPPKRRKSSLRAVKNMEQQSCRAPTTADMPVENNNGQAVYGGDNATPEDSENRGAVRAIIPTEPESNGGAGMLKSSGEPLQPLAHNVVGQNPPQLHYEPSETPLDIAFDPSERSHSNQTGGVSSEPQQIHLDTDQTNVSRGANDRYIEESANMPEGTEGFPLEERDRTDTDCPAVDIVDLDNTVVNDSADTNHSDISINEGLASAKRLSRLAIMAVQEEIERSKDGIPGQENRMDKPGLKSRRGKGPRRNASPNNTSSPGFAYWKAGSRPAPSNGAATTANEQQQRRRPHPVDFSSSPTTVKKKQRTSSGSHETPTATSAELPRVADHHQLHALLNQYNNSIVPSPEIGRKIREAVRLSGCFVQTDGSNSEQGTLNHSATGSGPHLSGASIPDAQCQMPPVSISSRDLSTQAAFFQAQAELREELLSTPTEAASPEPLLIQPAEAVKPVPNQAITPFREFNARPLSHVTPEPGQGMPKSTQELFNAVTPFAFSTAKKDKRRDADWDPVASAISGDGDEMLRSDALTPGLIRGLDSSQAPRLPTANMPTVQSPTHDSPDSPALPSTPNDLWQQTTRSRRVSVHAASPCSQTAFSITPHGSATEVPYPGDGQNLLSDVNVNDALEDADSFLRSWVLTPEIMKGMGSSKQPSGTMGSSPLKRSVALASGLG